MKMPIFLLCAATLFAWSFAGSKKPLSAIEELEVSAANGDRLSPFYLAGCYATGNGVPKDEAKAAELYQRIAAQGFYPAQLAQFQLGSMYADGRGVRKDQAKAAELYQKAADWGHSDAQFFLGLSYDEGSGVPKNEAKAAELYQKAAALGSIAAQLRLGLMFADGRGVRQDGVKAIELYEKAAAQGSSAAQFFLGLSYSENNSVSRDDVRAYAWFNLAAAQGDGDATRRRDELEKQMTVEQKAAAQKFSAELLKQMTDEQKSATQKLRAKLSEMTKRKQPLSDSVVALPKEPTSESQPKPIVSTPAASPTPGPSKQSNELPGSPELLTWYAKLQQERQALDSSDAEAVLRFNLQAANYHEALNAARSGVYARMTPIGGQIPIAPPIQDTVHAARADILK